MLYRFPVINPAVRRNCIPDIWGGLAIYHAVLARRPFCLWRWAQTKVRPRLARGTQQQVRHIQDLHIEYAGRETRTKVSFMTV